MPAEHFVAQVLEIEAHINRLASEANIYLLREILARQVFQQLTPDDLRFFYLIRRLYDANLAARRKAYFDYWCDITS